MSGRGCSCKRKHFRLKRKGEDQLRRRTSATGDKFRKARTGKNMSIGSKQRKSLIPYAVSFTEPSYLSIPASAGKAAVLDKAWLNGASFAEFLQLVDPHITDSQKLNFSAAVHFLHRAPNLPIAFRKSTACRGSMQDKGVEIVGVQVLKGTG